MFDAGVCSDMHFLCSLKFHTHHFLIRKIGQSHKIGSLILCLPKMLMMEIVSTTEHLIGGEHEPCV